MPTGLSQRGAGVKQSPTFAISTKAKAMKAEGHDVIDFGLGQPADFEPPENIKNAVQEALGKKGTGRYTPAPGLPVLRHTIAEKLQRDNGIKCNESNVMVTAGGKHALYNIMQVILDPGQEVIVPAPYWVSYPEMIGLAGGRQVTVETDDNFKFTAEAISEKISDKTKAIIINSPNNPTGAMADESELRGIAELAVEKDIYIISDECYEPFVYGNRMLSPGSLGGDIAARTFTVNTLSKTYAIPGWRIGYVAGPEREINAMIALQSHSTSNISSVLQHAAVQALQGPQDSVERMKEEFRKRRDFMVRELNNMGFRCPVPQGAFYVFPALPDGHEHAADSFRFVMELLDKQHVALVHGLGFGREGHVRISYAASMHDIKQGMDRISRFVE